MPAPPLRPVVAASGLVLVLAVAAASAWIAQPGLGAALASVLLLAALLIGVSLLPARIDAAAPGEVAAPTVAARSLPEAELLEQLEALRAAQRDSLVARQASEAAMLAKDEFLATMSHEIRTPLNGVLPLLELVLSTRLSPDQREYLSTAYGSAREMLRIVDDILDYSKLDVGKLELESIALNLRDLVDGVAQLMRRSAEAKGLRLTLSIDPNVRLAVRGDPVRLRQVLMNLVSNAIKFTQRGSVTLMVSRRGESAAAHELTFAVRDTGIGIAAGIVSGLFEPFVQGDASITRAYGGSGLGLVICKRLVDLMGGRIGVQSEPGRGSLFWFNVSLLKVMGDLPVARGLGGKRALVVSADAALVRRLENGLSSLGVQATIVATPSEGLGTLRASAGMSVHWRHDLLILDAAESASAAEAALRSLAADPALAAIAVLTIGAGGTEPASATVPNLPRGFGEVQLRGVLEALLDADARAARAPESTPVIAAETAAPLQALDGRVLLVEDNRVNLQVAQRLLAAHGVVVDSAANGEEALRRLDETTYDLVLMDCQMPVMDGHTATRRWRDIEAARGPRRLPIVAMTANAMAGDREKCLASGMDEYLSKPLNRATLAGMLARWLPSATCAHASTVAETAAAEEVAVDAAATRMRASPMATSAPAPALDDAIVDEIQDVMGEDFPLLVRLYLTETPPKIDALETAHDAGDAAAMIASAHALKSSSANLGASLLAELARRIEEGLRQDPPAAVGDAVVAMRGEYDRCALALTARIARIGRP